MVIEGLSPPAEYTLDLQQEVSKAVRCDLLRPILLFLSSPSFTYQNHSDKHVFQLSA